MHSFVHIPRLVKTFYVCFKKGNSAVLGNCPWTWELLSNQQCVKSQTWNEAESLTWGIQSYIGKNWPQITTRLAENSVYRQATGLHLSVLSTSLSGFWCTRYTPPIYISRNGKGCLLMSAANFPGSTGWPLFSRQGTKEYQSLLVHRSPLGKIVAVYYCSQQLDPKGINSNSLWSSFSVFPLLPD